MSKKYETRHFKITPSTFLIKWLVALHGLAALVVFFTSFLLIYKTITLALILLSLFLYLKQAITFNGFLLRYTTVFGWEIAYFNHHFMSIEITPSTVLTPYVVFLHYKIQNNINHKQINKYTAIFKDAMSKDDFRKLRVELKISGLHKPNS